MFFEQSLCIFALYLVLFQGAKHNVFKPASWAKKMLEKFETNNRSRFTLFFFRFTPIRKPFSKTMKQRSIILLLTLSVFSITALAQTKQPKTVRDFFMALPDKYFSLDCCMSMPKAKQKSEYLKRYLKVEDTANGYMSGYGDAAQEGFVLALFKRPNGTYLIGFYTDGEGGVEDTPWTVFLSYSGGKWTDVSRSVIAGYNKFKYIYELPRNGTTVEVFKKRKKQKATRVKNSTILHGRVASSC